MTPFRIIDQALLDATSERARQSPRLRMNHNFHAGNEAACHRLLNAVEPGSYCPPHRHLDPDKHEGIVILRGCLGLVFFDETG
jgi:cupin fold WbuC family metalloprotein